MSAAPSLADASHLAERAHAGQVDKAGNPYIEHVCTVSLALRRFGSNAEIAGILHDIVEDTSTTLGDLRAAGYPPEVVDAVDSVSQRGGESYDDLIVRAARHPLGRLVKLADNATNSDPERLALLPEEDARRLATKYARARELLLAHNADLLDLAARAAARYRVGIQVVVRDGYWDGPTNTWAIREGAYCDKLPTGAYACELHREHAGSCLEID